MALVSYKKHPILHELSSSIKSPEERTELVKKLLEKYPLEKECDRVRYAILEFIADYIVYASVKKEKEETRKLNKDIITPSKSSTIQKREVSMQRLQEAAEYDEVIETHINEDKNVILTKRLGQSITDKDRREIPHLASMDEVVQQLRYIVSNNVITPKEANTIKQMIIELEADKFIIEESYKCPISAAKFTQSKSKINYDGDTGYTKVNPITGKEEYYLVSENYLDFFNPKVWCELIKFYGPLKESTWEDLDNSMRWIIMTFENVINKRFRKIYPVFFDMIKWRIDKLSNKDIAQLLEKKYNAKHNDIYVSTTLTKTIPLHLANEFRRNYILHIFDKSQFLLSWKRCSTCGQIKPRVSFFWTKNSSGDGFYSKCKECRNGSTARELLQMQMKINEDFDEIAFIDSLHNNTEDTNI